MRLAFPGLTAALAERVAIVTPTSTLASVAIEQFNREQLALGKESWERPNIQGMEAWMTTCWQEARFKLPNAPSLLSPMQERELWRQIIAADRPDLFDLRAMASMAQRASRVLAEYQIPTDGEAWAEHADAQEFLRWQQKLEKRLKAENWITRSGLWRLLPGLITQDATAFVGLVSTSPGLKSLSRAIGDSVQNIGITYSNRPAIADAFEFASTAAEMEYVARSVRHLLETGQPRSIGILVADLPAQGEELIRTLNEVLYPSASSGDHVHVQTGIEAKSSIISNAVLLLELARPRVSLASAGAILRSAFIDGAKKERSLRAIANARLRRQREVDFSLVEIEDAADYCPILFQALRRISRLVEKIRSPMRLPAWSALFSDILDAAKWPAVEHITEAEQAAAECWSNALSELASLGLVSAPVSLDEALSHLNAILSRPVELGNWSSPVQVLDASSSEGIEFDHCFILNANEDAWPPRTSLSPVIPYKLQRAHQVPATHPDAVAEERARKTDALFTCAPVVRVTYCGNLSPSLRPYVQLANPESSSLWPGSIASQAFSGLALDVLEDNQAPALAPSEEVRGGAGIIKSQSLCPFKAFAEYRLTARGDDDASIGFDALERGECAHKALEQIWKELGSQQSLKALAEVDLAALVQKHVEQAVKEEVSNGGIRALTSLAERARLTKVVHQWLEIDQQRTMPFVVERLEEKREAELSGLKLSLRMDRVDRLNNGSLVLIDYKSGAQSTKRLEGTRPQEPQLLVYAAAIDEPIDGLYFGELKNRKPRAVGHGAGKHFSKQRGVQEHAMDWDRFLSDSRDAVLKIADEFRRGEAAVAPQGGACGYCQIKPICRIGDASVVEEDEE